MLILLKIAGAFTMLLGAVHFFMPVLFDFNAAIPFDGPKLKPFRLLFYRYDTQRSDVRGVTWVMNHCVSFVLVSIGVLDVFANQWLDAAVGVWLAGWIAAWWFLRAACQFYLGHRRGDWMVFAWFSLLGLLHVAAACHHR